MKRVNSYLENNKWMLPLVILFIFLLSRLLMYLVFIVWQYVNNVDIFIFDRMNNWDAGWYKSIATDGYAPAPSPDGTGEANWAFFPLMPLVMRYLIRFTHGNVNVVTCIANSLFFLAGLVASASYICKTRNDYIEALLFCLIYSFGPYSFYFSIFYSESLFFLFVVLFFIFMNEERYIAMGVVGALASATRNLGVLLVFAVAVQYTSDYLKRGSGKSLWNYWKEAFKNYRLVLGVALIPLGLFGFMVFLWYKMGDPLAFAHIQYAWGEHESSLQEVIKALTGRGTRRKIYFALVGIFGLIGSIHLARTKRWGESVMGVLFILVPFSVRTTSLPRYVMGAYLPVLGWTDVFCKQKAKWLGIILIILALLECVLFYWWLEGKNILI